MTMCLRSIKLSLTENRISLIYLTKVVIDNRLFVPSLACLLNGTMMDLVKVYKLIGWLEHMMALHLVGGSFFPFLFTMNSFMCAKIIIITIIMTLKHHHQYLSHPILHHKMSLLAWK